MRNSVYFSAAPLLALALAQAALAQDANSPPTDDETAKLEAEAREKGEIVVVADRVRGQVDAPQAPIQTLNEQDIASYGASSVTDLLAALAPQTGSGRGRGGGMPVMLVNGQRITNFREMRNFPPESIKRVEILPEEVALRYGFSANQRVVNMILKDNYSSKTAEIEYSQPDRGGSSTTELEASLFKTTGKGRVNITASRDKTTPLTEGERGVIQTLVPTVTTDPDPAFARTLISKRTNSSLNATYTSGFGPKGLDGSLTLNGTITRTDTHALSGLNSVTLTSPTGAKSVRTFGDPLKRDNQTTSYQGGIGLNKPLGAWQLSATVDASRNESDTLIDRRASTSALVAAAAGGTQPINGPLNVSTALGSDRANAINTSISSLVTLVGRPVRLPGGDVSLTLKGGYNHTGIDSQDTRTLLGKTSLRRNEVNGGINIGIPITSRRENFLSAIGDVTLNFSAGLSDLSDFGRLVDWSAGFNWKPTEKLSFQTSYIVNDSAPSLSELGNPQVVSFNVPVFDFTRNETALVTVTTGGNPALLKEKDRDLKLGAYWQLPFLSNSNLMVEYFRNNSDNVTASFPVLTPDIEAAFPGRVTRDSSGRLIAIDRRSVTFYRENSSRLRWGLQLSGPVGKAPAAGRGGFGPPGGMRGPGGFGGGPPMMMGPGGPGGQGRWNIAIFHTVQFQNRVLVAANGPLLNLLDGDALSGGGVARHSIEFEGGVFYKGAGLRLNGNYSAPTHVNGTGAPGSTDLRFGSLAKFNLRLFLQPGQQNSLIKAKGFWKGTRFGLKVDNIFDSRQRVTDQTGAVPIGYQPDLLDPNGRVIGVEFRKSF